MTEIKNSTNTEEQPMETAVSTDTPLFPPPPVASMSSSKISEEKPSEPLPSTSTNAVAPVTSTCKRCFKVFNRFVFYLKHVQSNECSVLYNGHWCSFCKRYFQTKKLANRMKRSID